jgi:hypothetical protein
MRFRKRPEAIEATQWFANGDHPQDYAHDRPFMEGGVMRMKPGKLFKDQEYEGGVVRYFRRPDLPGHTPCVCGRIMDHHGWIDSGGDGQTVCPGDYVITNADGTYTVMKPDAFTEQYTKDRM